MIPLMSEVRPINIVVAVFLLQSSWRKEPKGTRSQQRRNQTNTCYSVRFDTASSFSGALSTLWHISVQVLSVGAPPLSLSFPCDLRPLEISFLFSQRRVLQHIVYSPAVFFSYINRDFFHQYISIYIIYIRTYRLTEISEYSSESHEYGHVQNQVGFQFSQVTDLDACVHYARPLSFQNVLR